MIAYEHRYLELVEYLLNAFSDIDVEGTMSVSKIYLVLTCTYATNRVMQTKI